MSNNRNRNNFPKPVNSNTPKVVDNTPELDKLDPIGDEVEKISDEVTGELGDIELPETPAPEPEKKAINVAEAAGNILEEKGIVKSLNPPVEKAKPQATTSDGIMSALIDKIAAPALKAGTKVKLKDDVTTTVTGTAIPAFAHKNVYKIDKVLPRRIIIACGNYSIAVSSDDVIPM